MRLKLVIAILLMTLGIVALVYQGITYTSMSKGVDIGSMHMAIEQTHHIPLPPILGAIALVSGIVLLLFERNRSRHMTGQ